MKKKILRVMGVLFLFTNMSIFFGDVDSFLVSPAKANIVHQIDEGSGEGGGPSACGVVCCDRDIPLSLPPLHVRCEILCIPVNFCIATGGSSILCDFTYLSCNNICSDVCNGIV